MRKWVVAENKVVLENPRFKVEKDVCITGNGTLIPEYYRIVSKSDGVNIFGVTTDGKVVLVKQYRHGIKEITFELPAGSIEDGENAIDAAKRELLEETGYLAKDIILEKVLYIAAGFSQKTYIYFAKGLELSKKRYLDQFEDIDVKLVEFDEIDELIDKNIIKGATHTAAILLAQKKRNWFFGR